MATEQLIKPANVAKARHQRNGGNGHVGSFPLGGVQVGEYFAGGGIYQGNGRLFAIPVAEGEGAAEAGELRYCGGTLACTSLDVRGGSVVVNGAPGTRRDREIPPEIDGFWSFTRQWLRHYRGVPRAYFPLYLKEIEWRYNHRGENLVRLARGLLGQRVAAEDPRMLP